MFETYPHTLRNSISIPFNFQKIRTHWIYFMEADDSNDQYTVFPNLHIEGEIRQMFYKDDNIPPVWFLISKE